MASSNSSSSCATPKPFVQLGDGLKAPILNYNLPQKTCYHGNGYFPLAIQEDFFAEEFRDLPAGNPWDTAAGMSLEQITDRLRDEVLGSAPSLLLRGANLLKSRAGAIRFLADDGVKYLQPDPKPKVVLPNDNPMRVMSLDADDKSGSTPQRVRINHQQAMTTLPPEKVILGGYTLAYLAEQVDKGLIPEFYVGFDRRLKVRFLPRPEVRPRLSIVEHYRVCSFLGDYGAGKVVKTFSLLPGESTTITVRSYKDMTSSFVKSSNTSTNEYVSSYYAQDEQSVATLSENILEGYSEHSANQLQSQIESMSQEASGSSTSIGSSMQANSGSGSQGGFNLFAVYNAQFGGGSSLGTSITASSNGYRDTLMSQLNSAINNTVNESGSYRDINVNSTTGNTSNQSTGGGGGSSATMTVSQQESTLIKAGEESSTVRYIQNINHSRVLNFVFRQMLQEYIVLTWLEDVSIVLHTGYPGHQRTVKLSMLEPFLEELFPNAANRNLVRKAILLHLCNVANYQGTLMPFAERVTETFQDCLDGLQIPAIQYWRKRPSLVDTYSSGGLEIAVPGVILNVQSHILRTDSVIVDAVLGQGEALDCYNIRLQDAAATAAEYANDFAKQESVEKADRNAAALAILSGITDPVQAAEAYRKMFGECCMEDIMLLLNAAKSTEPA